MKPTRWLVLWLAVLFAAVLTSCGTGDDDDGGGDDDDGGDDADDDDDDGPPRYVYQPEEGPYDFFLFTTDDLLGAVDEFAGFKQWQGFSVEVVSVDALDLGDGDLPDAIRAHLAAGYDPDLTQYVLVVGSHQVIPMRYFYLDPEAHNIEAEYTTPSDYYYADLDTEWDADGDGFFGEWGDDFSGEWIGSTWGKEMLPGRIPWDSPEDVRPILTRIIDYELVPQAQANVTTLLIGGQIIYAGDAVALMELIKMHIDVPPFSGNIFTMYGQNEVAEGDYHLDHDTLMEVWPELEPGFVMWASHGSPQGAFTSGIGEAFIQNEDVPALAGVKPGLVFSTGCNNAVPEEESLGFLMIRDVCAAFIGSTRVTHPGNYGEGAIAVFPEGVEALLVGNVPLGLAMADAIEYYMEELFDPDGEYPPPLFFRNIFGFSLLGDPSMTFRSEG